MKGVIEMCLRNIFSLSTPLWIVLALCLFVLWQPQAHGQNQELSILPITAPTMSRSFPLPKTLSHTRTSTEYARDGQRFWVFPCLSVDSLKIGGKQVTPTHEQLQSAFTRGSKKVSVDVRLRKYDGNHLRWNQVLKAFGDNFSPRITKIFEPSLIGKMRVRLEYQDPNGETVVIDKEKELAPRLKFAIQPELLDTLRKDNAEPEQFKFVVTGGYLARFTELEFEAHADTVRDATIEFVEELSSSPTGKRPELVVAVRGGKIVKSENLMTQVVAEQYVKIIKGKEYKGDPMDLVDRLLPMSEKLIALDRIPDDTVVTVLLLDDRLRMTLALNKINKAEDYIKDRTKEQIEKDVQKLEQEKTVTAANASFVIDALPVTLGFKHEKFRMDKSRYYQKNMKDALSVMHKRIESNTGIKDVIALDVNQSKLLNRLNQWRTTITSVTQKRTGKEEIEIDVPFKVHKPIKTREILTLWNWRFKAVWHGDSKIYKKLEKKVKLRIQWKDHKKRTKLTSAQLDIKGSDAINNSYYNKYGEPISDFSMLKFDVSNADSVGVKVYFTGCEDEMDETITFYKNDGWKRESNELPFTCGYTSTVGHIQGYVWMMSKVERVQGK